MTTTKKNLPDFNTLSPAEELDFWDTADLSSYISSEDIGKSTLQLRDKSRKAKDELVAFRLETYDLEKLKDKAVDLGIGHSTLLRMLVKRYLIEPKNANIA